MSKVVKRRGHKEEYDEKKAYASIYSACRNVHMSEPDSEAIASRVITELNDWVAQKKEVSSQEIFEQSIVFLAKHSEDASFMYKTHRDLS